MSPAQRHPISMKPVVYRIDGMDRVTIRRDVEYRTTDSGALTMDLYRPPAAGSGARIPAVVVVGGFPGAGLEKHIGCTFKEMESCISWGRLMAASGLMAITYTNREPEADLRALLQCLRQNAAVLGIDETRIGVWASSGNVPLALSVLMKESGEHLKCGVLCYGFMMDLDGSTGIAGAARQWGFANPCEGKTVGDLPTDVPLFVARAGREENPNLNEALDRFVAHALTNNLSLTFANHATGAHAFDIVDDSETSRAIVRQILTFVRCNLLAVSEMEVASA